MRIFGQDLRLAKAPFGGRRQSAGETFREYSHFMPTMGITRLANLTGLDRVGMPVFMAVRPNARSLVVSQGKGLDVESARVSALMESIETWHAEHVDRPVRCESHHSLAKSEATLDLDAVELQMGCAVDRTTTLPWIEGYDLLREAPTWVPLELVSLDFVRAPGQHPTFPQSSDGLASGTHLLEAVLFGLCELIERDAASLWFASPVEGKASQLDLSTVREPRCAGLIERVHAAGLTIAAYDNTSDLGIPSYQAILLDPPGNVRPMGYFWGFGCALSPQTALLRAMTEAVQCRLTEISGTRDDITEQDYAKNRNDEQLTQLYRAITQPAPQLPFESRSSIETDSVDGDIEVLLQALRQAQIASVVVVDLAKPELGIPVVKVMVPDLEGFPFSHEPGARACRVR